MRRLTTGAAGTKRAAGVALLASMTMTWMLTLAACGGSVGAAAAATPAPATSAPATSAASPSPSAPASAGATSSAAVAPGRTYVSGTMGCEAIKETPVEGVEKTVRITFDCPFEMSDPRVTGSQPMECDEGFYDLTELLGGVGVWDTCSMVLTGRGGSWKAVTAYGSEFMKSSILRTTGTQIYEGQGAFAGLRFVTFFSASPELTKLYGEGYHVAGWIEPAE